jgi:hypothetical protein
VVSGSARTGSGEWMTGTVGGGYEYKLRRRVP